MAQKVNYDRVIINSCWKFINWVRCFHQIWVL